jgi:predicted dehydrogenase
MGKIRVGIFGAGRGMELAKSFMLLDTEIVALCDNHAGRREAALKRLDKGVAAYDNFDEFIEHPMDAVILANNFYQHAPYTIKCFEKNIHVFCECTSNGTMGEGVALARAFEKTKSIYMLAENYPQSLYNREMKRIADSGTLGKIIYAEGEYNHPVDPWDTKFTKTYRFYPEHWRHFLPRTYYITHALGPIMNATGATPKKVTAFAMYAPVSDDVPSASHVADRASNITTMNDDGSVFRVIGDSGIGAHHNGYRLCGTKGQVENIRGTGGKVLLRYNSWEIPEGEESLRIYLPTWNDKDEELIKKSGHGGADFITVRMFVECVKAGKQPPHPFDLHSAIAMSSVAILAHRSVLDGGKVYDIPDFRNEEDCKLYENDHLTPFFGDDGSAPTLPCCSHPEYRPSAKQMELYFKELEKE